MPAGRRARTKSPTRWGKWELDDDDRDLISKYDIRVTQRTQNLISNTYWSTIHQIIPAQKANQSTLPASYALNTVNWIQVFFDYLVKPPATSESSDGGFSIPETAIIRRRRATQLIRSDPEHGRQHVDRVTQTAMLEPSALFETLMTAAAKLVPVMKPTTVVAVLIASTFDDRQGWVPVVEYMTEEILKSYLFTRLMVEDREAILQVFVPPAGAYNTLIRAYYSPHSLKLEQRVNLVAVTDPYKDPQRRCATFDGPNHYSEMRAIPGMDLRDQLSETIDLLMARVAPQLPASKTVQKGLFYFKMGKDGQLWFLFCSSLFVTNANSTGSPAGKDRGLNLRPITPASVQSSWFTEGAQTAESKDPFSGTSKLASSAKMLLEDGCPSCSARPKPAEMLPVPFMSLLRRLNPQLYTAVVREAAIAKEASRLPEMWASYLEAAQAAALVFYGETLATKFPRIAPPALVPGTAASRQSRRKDARDDRGDGEQAARVAKCVRWLRLVAQAHRPSHRLTASSEFSPAKFSSGKVTPALSPQAASPNGDHRGGGGGEATVGSKALGAQEQRELVLYVATNLSTFEELQAAVCTECCLTMNKSDLAKAFKVGFAYMACKPSFHPSPAYFLAQAARGCVQRVQQQRAWRRRLRRVTMCAALIRACVRAHLNRTYPCA